MYTSFHTVYSSKHDRSFIIGKVIVQHLSIISPDKTAPLGNQCCPIDRGRTTVFLRKSVNNGFPRPQERNQTTAIEFISMDKFNDRFRDWKLSMSRYCSTYKIYMWI